MSNVLVARRGFLKGTAYLTFGLTLSPTQLLAEGGQPKTFSPHAMLRIDPDNTIRIIMPHAEMGQGAYTGMAQVLAEELDANWAHVIAEHLQSLDPAYNHQDWATIATGASTSLSNQWQNLREVGASARAMLVEAAAKKWGVAANTLRTEKSMVIDSVGQRKISYGELSALAAKLDPPKTLTLKNPDQFTLIGQDLQRVDSVSKASGAANFGMDLNLPDMLVAVIAHCPVFGGKLHSYDDGAAKAMPGVRRIVEIPTGVAVVADTFWQAKKAKDALQIKWDKGTFANTSSQDLWTQYHALAEQAGPKFEQRGSVDFQQSDTQITGEMRFPFLAHAPMEPLNTTVQLSEGLCEIWSGTQFQGIDAGNIEQLTGIPIAEIKINTQFLGGSFGRRAAPKSDFLVEAVQIAQAAKLANPIKMIWLREDDVQGGYYRPMVLHRYKIGVDKQGLPKHWAHQVVGASISKGTAFESAFMVDGLDTLSTEGLRHNAYQIENVDFTLHTPKHALEVLWLRSEADSHTGPVVETILNRLARHAKADPLAYRRQLLSNNKDAFRILGVLDALQQTSNWDLPQPENVFRGVAVHPSFGSVAGYVVDIKKTGNQLSFHKVTAAMDCGRVINPAGVKAQIYGSVAFALSMVIGQKIEIKNGAAVQSNFHDYPVAKLKQVPDVEVVLVDNGLAHPTGVGEVGVPPFIPALTEAIFAATGQEIDEFPMILNGYSFLDS